MSNKQKQILSLSSYLSSALQRLEGAPKGPVFSKSPGLNSTDTSTSPLDIVSHKKLRRFDKSKRLNLGKKLFVDQFKGVELLRDDPEVFSDLSISSLHRTHLKSLYEFYQNQNRREALSQISESCSLENESTRIKNKNEEVNNIETPDKVSTRRRSSVLREPAIINSISKRINFLTEFDEALTESRIQEYKAKINADDLKRINSFINQLNYASMIIVLKNLEPGVSDINYLELSNHLNRLNSRNSSTSSLRVGGSRVVRLKSIDEVQFLSALQNDALGKRANRNDSGFFPFKPKELRNYGAFYGVMLEDLTKSIKSANKHLQPALREDFDTTLTDFNNDAEFAKATDILKAIKKDYCLISLDLTSSEKLKKLPDIFKVLSEYVGTRKEFAMIFCQLNYHRIPMFGKGVIENLEPKNTLHNTNKKVLYSHYLELARQNTKMNTNNNSNPQDESVFQMILTELANNDMTFVDKPKDKECLYIYRGGK
ncbi:hypothetical protein DASC09_005520 [Saccharomycopsis crataegensis]|uniref:Uncharacterized protein n=1 Tax=Saccharomycopsis crataegensis TaxID=43959 RepID=A0AAV5QF37_9ASCO|nr:hypothetical protein DASC09_005520 [Saccharomycopsis crataegensis]